MSQRVNEKAHDFTVLDRGYEHSEVSRRVVYLPGPDCWIVVDSSTSPAPAPLVQHWHLEPGTTTRFRDRGFRLTREGASLGMTWLGRTPAILRRKFAEDGDMRGWIGTAWKELSAGTLLTAATRDSESNRLVTLISPNSPQPLGVVESLVQLDGTVSAVLNRGGRPWRVHIGPSEARVLDH